MLVGLAVLAATGWWWARRVIPALDGRAPVSGLAAPVEVRFDGVAIPHIYAGSEEDAWVAVGYLQARDRMWQMELYRRAASGRLSELLGEAAVPIDQRFLTLGLRRAAETEWERLAPAVRAAFSRYALGVNAAMSVGRWRLPLELQLLRVQPEPWTPIDSLAIGKLFAWRLGENHRAELLRGALRQSLGPRAEELLPAPPEWAPTILGSLEGQRVESKEQRAKSREQRAESQESRAKSREDPRLSTQDFRPLTLDSRLWTTRRALSGCPRTAGR